MSENTTVIREFADQFEALMMADQLKSAGIECFISNDNLNNNNPLIMALPIKILLHVFEKDVELANSILQDFEDQEEDGDMEEIQE
jgi:hypothetical protein